MNEKFKLWGGGKQHGDTKVYRVQALQDFNDVEKGQLGGYVESEDNISSALGDNSWVYDDAVVKGKSSVQGNSMVDGNSVVRDSRIEEESRISHGSSIRHSRATNAVIQNSDTFYANVQNSMISEECDVRNSRVADSELGNGASVYNSRVAESELVNDAKVSKGSYIENSKLDEAEVKRGYTNECELYDTKVENEKMEYTNNVPMQGVDHTQDHQEEMFTEDDIALSDDDLKDLDTSQGMQQ